MICTGTGMWVVFGNESSAYRAVIEAQLHELTPVLIPAATATATQHPPMANTLKDEQIQATNALIAAAKDVTIKAALETKHPSDLLERIGTKRLVSWTLHHLTHNGLCPYALLSRFVICMCVPTCAGVDLYAVVSCWRCETRCGSEQEK